MEAYTEMRPYRTDANGVTYRDRMGTLNGREKHYSHITVPRNPKRKDPAPYRVLMLSDSHIAAEFGSWGSETRYRFHNGSHLVGWWRTTWILPANTPVTFHIPTVVEANGVLKTYAAEENTVLTEETRLSFVSDMQFSVPDGTEIMFPYGVSAWERGLILTDRILYEWDTHPFDALFLLGDIVSSEENKWKDSSDIGLHYWTLFKNRYLSRLENAGLPYFYVYANHDDLNDEQFAHFFPYTKNYTVEIGGALFLCLDHFATPNPENCRFGYGAPSDSDINFLASCEGLVQAYENVYLMSHYFPTGFERTGAYIARFPQILAGFEGHSHNTTPRRFSVLGGIFTAFEVGNFSWQGDEWGLASDGSTTEFGVPSGAWSFCVLEGCPENASCASRVYRIYPEVPYGTTVGCGYINKGKVFPAFYQPRYVSVTEPVGTIRHESILKNKRNVK